MPTVGEIIEALFDKAPACLAAEGDNVGLQVGDPAAPVGRILLAVDVTPGTIAAAEEASAELLLAHHPLLVRPLRRLAADEPVGEMAQRAIRAGLSVVSMHTNVDVAPGGLCDLLASALGVTQARPLVSLGGRAVKLAAFVPEAHLDRVREAMSQAGAGRIGNYEECAFETRGRGCYRPLPGAKPFAGEVGTLEFAEEARLEMLVAKSLLPRVIAAMTAAHPYEEVAYDVYPLENAFPGAGFGRLGSLEEPVPVEEFAARAKKALGVHRASLVGEAKRQVERIAVNSGSGGGLVEEASRAGAQLLVAADSDHHQRLLAEQLGVAILDLGHLATERLVVDFFRGVLAERFGERLLTLKAEEADPFRPI
jgi:dinuclear metal center YbgI/SA1388 family protein